MKSASGRSRAKVAKAALISPLVRVRNGQLIPVPGTAIDYDWIAYALGEDAARMNIVRLNYDRWRIEFYARRWRGWAWRCRLSRWGKDLRRCCPRWRRSRSPRSSGGSATAAIHSCAGVSRMRWWRATPAGNRKLDVAVAAVMAVGAMKASTVPPVEVAALIA